MRALTLVVALSVACLAYAAPAAAQEGHPLKGSWLGTWASSPNHTDDLVVVLKWDGKAISGIVNPGTDNMVIKNATLNPDGWQVHFEADGKDKAGKPLNYVFDGKIENLGLPHRSIVGTWKDQTESGQLKISRQ
jgi:hypothetical protein